MLFFAALTCLMVLVMYFDFTRYIIPNWLNALVGIMYPLMVLTTAAPIAWNTALIGAIIVFAVGYGVYRMGWMGAGDIKLFTVTALWIGAARLPEYIMVVAVLGGLMSIAVVLLRKMAPMYYGRGEGKMPPRILQYDAPLPYGLAIASGFTGYLWGGLISGVSMH